MTNGLDLWAYVKRRLPAVGADRTEWGSGTPAPTFNKSDKDSVVIFPAAAEKEAGMHPGRVTGHTHTFSCNHQTVLIAHLTSRLITNSNGNNREKKSENSILCRSHNSKENLRSRSSKTARLLYWEQMTGQIYHRWAQLIFAHESDHEKEAEKASYFISVWINTRSWH